MRKYNNQPPRQPGGFFQWLPILLLIGAAYFIYNKFKDIFNHDATRSQAATNESQDTIIKDLSKKHEPTNKQRNVADKLFKLLNTQNATGINVFGQLFTDSGQKTLTPSINKQVRDLLFAPNCTNFGELKQTIVAYGQRRHDNRESLLLGFIWDDHKYSLPDAVNNFLSEPLKTQMNNLINDCLNGDDSTKIYYKNYIK